MDELAARISDDPTQAFYDYWKSRKRDTTLPRWGDFDPVEMRQWLGWINVIEALPDGDGFRFRYRVHGDYLSRFLGVEMTGRFADEIPEKTVRKWAVLGYTAVARTGAPTLERYIAPNSFDRPFTIQRLTAPVLDEAMLLLLAFFRIEP